MSRMVYIGAMRNIQVYIFPSLLAFFGLFVHGDVQAGGVDLGDIEIISTQASPEGLQEFQVKTATGPINFNSLPFFVVETHEPHANADWLKGSSAQVLGQSGRFWRVGSSGQTSFVDLWRALRKHSKIKHGFPDMVRFKKTMGVSIDDPYYPAQWYLEELNAEVLWEKSFGDALVKVAVIDSGIDTAHPDLQSKIIAPKDTWDDDDDPSPNAGEFCFGGMSGICDQHGTAVAGIILADTNDLNIIGVCPDCSLIPIKMLGEGYLLPTTSTLSGDIIAFEHAISQDAAVINNSWGFNEHIAVPAPLASIIKTAATQNRGGKGAVVVFAAGNEDREILNDELSALEDVLSISATDRYGNPTPYTNYGASVDLAAPAATLSLAPGGGITESFGGTSSAAPIVSGVAAWILSVKPELTAAEVRALLRSTARQDPRYQYDHNGHNEMVGQGLLDLEKLIEKLYPAEEEEFFEEEAIDAWGCSHLSLSLPTWSLLVLLIVRRRRRFCV